jgi:hypothetical protein
MCEGVELEMMDMSMHEIYDSRIILVHFSTQCYPTG